MVYCMSLYRSRITATQFMQINNKIYAFIIMLRLDTAINLQTADYNAKYTDNILRSKYSNKLKYFRRCLEDMRSRDSHFNLTVERAQNTSSMLAEQAGLFSKHPPSPNVPPHLTTKPSISLLPSRLPQSEQPPRNGPPTPPRRTVSRTPPRRSASSTASHYSSLSPSPSFSSQDSDPMSRQIRDAQMRQSRALRPALPPKTKNFGYNTARIRKGSRGSEVSESSEISMQSLRSERSLDHRYLDQDYPDFRDDRVDLFRKRNSQSIESSSERNSADLSDHVPAVIENGHPQRPSDIRLNNHTFNPREDTTFPVRNIAPQKPTSLNLQHNLSRRVPLTTAADNKQETVFNKNQNFTENKMPAQVPQLPPKGDQLRTNNPARPVNHNQPPPLTPRSPPITQTVGVNPNDITRALENLLSPNMARRSPASTNSHSPQPFNPGPEPPPREVPEPPPRSVSQPPTRSVPEPPAGNSSQLSDKHSPTESLYVEMFSPKSGMSSAVPRRLELDKLVKFFSFLFRM